MTEYETATLAIQQATLALQQSALTLAYYSNLIALGVGIVQGGLIWWGIRKMAAQGDKREQQHADRHAETMEALRHQAETAKAQHTETMEASQAQHTEAVEASQAQHAETMEAFRHQAETAKAQHTETMEALRQQGEALKALIERTAPPTER